MATLSDKIQQGYKNGVSAVPVDDVREFIKNVKDVFDCDGKIVTTREAVFRWIDGYAGDALVGEGVANE